MDEKNFFAAKMIYDKIEEIKKQISNVNFLLSVVEQRTDAGNTENIKLNYHGEWKGKEVDIVVPTELYLTALQMVKKNYLDKMVELDKNFKKI